VYYAFDRNQNCKALEDNPSLPLLVGMDFNVNPMCASLAIRVADQLHTIGEIVLSNSNTNEMSAVIKGRFPGRSVRVYPDPTGNARKTSAPVGATDFAILRAAGFTVLAPSHPYPVADKINTVNSALCSVSGLRHVYIDPVKCPQTVKGLDGMTYRDGTNEPDKSLGLDHITDALAYLVCYELPLRSRTQQIAWEAV
jgi:hypothetical protein